MPAKPAWFSRINEVILDLESLPLPFVDRATLQSLLRVGPRRAQQIMAPCISDPLGSSALADPSTPIPHLRRLANGDDGVYERPATLQSRSDPRPASPTAPCPAPPP